MAQKLPVLVWLRLARVFQKMDHASSDALRRWNLSTAQFDVLAQLGQAEGITQQELADRLLVTKGNICQLLNRMEQSGLIRRQQEGRANRLFLTVEGRALFNEVVPVEEAVLVEQFAALTLDEQRQLLALLRTLDHALL